MKSIILICLFATVAMVMGRPGTTYTDRWDTINLDEILANRRLLIPYMKCMLDKGKCSPEGKELKSHLKEALETDCAKCTDKQKSGSRQVIAHLINHEADYWNQLSEKYDPNHKYSRKYENELRKVKA